MIRSNSSDGIPTFEAPVLECGGPRCGGAGGTACLPLPGAVESQLDDKPGTQTKVQGPATRTDGERRGSSRSKAEHPAVPSFGI